MPFAIFLGLICLRSNARVALDRAGSAHVGKVVLVGRIIAAPISGKASPRVSLDFGRADTADRRSQSRNSGHVFATNTFARLGLTKLGIHLSAKSTNLRHEEIHEG
jgi:N-formylglutamate amidohydrolase